MAYSLIMTACEDKDEAKGIAEVLLEKKLAACVQIQEIESLYTWKGKTENSKEALLFIKTKTELYWDVEKEISTLHKYHVPEIVEIPINRGLPSYFKWIDEVTK